MAETPTKAAKSQDAEKAQEKKRRLEPAPVPTKVLAGESIPFPRLLNGSAMEPPIERHAAVLGDRRFSHSVNNSQKAGLVTELQQNYGNAYVQKVVDLIQAEKDEHLPEEEPDLADIGQRIAQEKSSGQPLEPKTRSEMEAAFGEDFSGVRMHTNSEADRLSKELGAKAFTSRKDIFFCEGSYEPSSESGKKLIGHELAHVVQQETGTTSQKESNSQAGDRFEQEAAQAGQAVAEGRMASPRATSPVPDVQLEVPGGAFLGAKPAKTKGGEGKAKIEPPPKTTEEVIALGEQGVRDQAARIVDKNQALMILFGGALEIFAKTLEAPSSAEVEPQIGKVLLDYATDEVLGIMAKQIPGASRVYDVYKKIEEKNKEIETKVTLRQIAKFYKAYKEWITEEAANLERYEREAEMEAEDIYHEKPTKDAKAKYWLMLKTRADFLEQHLAETSVTSIITMLAGKWIAETKTKLGLVMGSAYIEIILDKAWKVTKAHIHAPRGQTIADEFNERGGIEPLDLEARKNVYAEGYEIPGLRGELLVTHLKPSNDFDSGGEELFDEIKKKGIPVPDKWSGD